jgi:TRAP transporter 4TM/12TM fusion protein
MPDTPVLVNEKRENRRFVEIILLLTAISLALFHLYTASFGILTGYIQAAIHWTFVGTFVVLTHPLKFRGGAIIDAALIMLNIVLTFYELKLQEEMITSAGIYSTTDLLMSVLALIMTFEISRRVLGYILPGICLVFIAYAYFGSHIPGLFKTVSFSLKRIATHLFSAEDGLYGSILYVSAQFIFLFVLFGAILDITGAGSFFVDLATSIAGRTRGGSAQAAVYSSMLMGMINGSGPANVVTTGTFTIPLMKRVGYKPSMAGAVEAVASSGGQIMPPVMGAAAFLMSEITGIKYSDIVIAAFVPAVLYYLTLSASVYLTARHQNMPKPDPASLPKLGRTLKKGWYYFAPLIVLLLLLVKGFSAQRSAFWAIAASLAVGFIFERKNMTARRLIAAARSAASGIGPIAAACLCAGIIMGTINITGVGLKISGIIEAVSGNRMLIALLLTMATSLILGMGLPTSAAYVVLAGLVAPAIINMGASKMAAHLFLLYFGALSSITPPVALSVFAACSISNASLWETGRDAVKLAVSGFIIPFIFVFNTELLLMGSIGMILIALVTALIGCILLSISNIGWCGTDISPPGRILLFASAIMLIVVEPLWINFAGFALMIVVLAAEISIHKYWGHHRKS